MKPNWDHFDKNSVTILDRRIMKALALKAGVLNESTKDTIKYSGHGLFYYRGRWFMACGYKQKTGDKELLTDPEGHIVFWHIAAGYFDFLRYLHIVETQIGIDATIIAEIGYHRFVWRVFKFLFEQTRWRKQFPTAVALLEEAIRLIDTAAYDPSYKKMQSQSVGS